MSGSIILWLLIPLSMFAMVIGIYLLVLLVRWLGRPRREPAPATHRPIGDAADRLPPLEVPPEEFEGYVVEAILPSGGSGARLLRARVEPERQQEWLRAGLGAHPNVVIKAFTLGEGSTLPQIVRESRALESARKTGLVLDHRLDATRFYYVMPYIAGDDLNEVAERLHAESPADGLSEPLLKSALRHIADILETLQSFHQAGLWHKDIKPSNVIVTSERAQVIDLGLVTPLQSGMTLTTAGTEYYRDPEMVRQALRGVKVHQIDGVKFDLYSVGALLFFLIENSFPAHGSLSQLSKRCPSAVAWIIRRAMADVGQRYGSAGEMLTDVRTVISHPRPLECTPAMLPHGPAVDPPPPAATPSADLAAAGSVAPLPGPWQPRPLPRALRMQRLGIRVARTVLKILIVLVVVGVGFVMCRTRLVLDPVDGQPASMPTMPRDDPPAQPIRGT